MPTLFIFQSHTAGVQSSSTRASRFSHARVGTQITVFQHPGEPLESEKEKRGLAISCPRFVALRHPSKWQLGISFVWRCSPRPSLISTYHRAVELRIARRQKSPAHWWSGPLAVRFVWRTELARSFVAASTPTRLSNALQQHQIPFLRRLGPSSKVLTVHDTFQTQADKSYSDRHHTTRSAVLMTG